MYEFAHFGNLLDLFDALGYGIKTSKPTKQDFDAWWKEDSLVLAIAMPGFDKGNISVLAEKGLLAISASYTEEKDKDYLVKSNLFNKDFVRKFEIPEGMNVENIGCTYENGVLTIIIKKLEDRKPKKIEIR